MSIIQDGTGRGFQAEVSSRNELKTVSSTLSTFERATIEEEAFNINTLFLPYTIGADSALLFVQNNEAQPIILQGWFIGTTGGSGGDPIVQVFGGVTGFSAGTPVDVPVVNRNVGSARTFNITGADRVISRDETDFEEAARREGLPIPCCTRPNPIRVESLATSSSRCLVAAA